MDRLAEPQATIESVDSSGFGHRLGLRDGDQIVSVNGVVPRDILEWQRHVDADDVDLEVRRKGVPLRLSGRRIVGEPTGIRVDSAVFDRIHTCDNHCDFCFIYQLPKGLRRSLYLKDDDYRLSFLYGNFTTLTRFTEADLERVIDEKLSPLNVSIHSGDPMLRSTMLRNERGGVSLRWLAALLEAGIVVNGQIVLCPGVNDGDRLDDTLLEVLQQYPGLERLAVVPLGLSRHNPEPHLVPPSADDARRLIRQTERWREVFLTVLGRPVVYLADEVFLLASEPVPEVGYYDGFDLTEDGVGMVRLFVEEFASGQVLDTTSDHPTFFRRVDRAPTNRLPASPTDYNTPSNPAQETALRSHATSIIDGTRTRFFDFVPDELVVLTGSCFAPMLTQTIADHRRRSGERIVVFPVENHVFGGSTSVAGLLCGADVRAAIESCEVDGARRVFLLPDSCLNEGRFLDGMLIDEIRIDHDVRSVPPRGHVLSGVLDEFIESLEGSSQ